MDGIKNAVIDSVRGELERFAGAFVPEELDRETAVGLVEQLGGVRNLVDGLLAKALKRAEDVHAHRATGDRDAAALCARLIGSGVREVRRAVETASALEGLPATDAAVRAGRLSAKHAQMIAAASAINPEAELDLIATAAQGLVPLKDACIAARAVVEDSAARAARQRAARCFRMWSNDDGVIEGHFRLPPEVGGPFKVAIDTETQRIFRAQHAIGSAEPHDRYAADTLVASVLSMNGMGTKVSVHIVIDHAALVRGNVLEGERCLIPGVGPVSVEWVRRLLGTAFVTAVIEKGKDIATVAHMGRYIPAELRTALLVQGHECDIEDCNSHGYLELDHSEVDFAAGGPTAYWNMKYRCSIHHLRKTQGWILGPPDPVTGKRRLLPPDAEQSAA